MVRDCALGQSGWVCDGEDGILDWKAPDVGLNFGFATTRDVTLVNSDFLGLNLICKMKSDCIVSKILRILNLPLVKDL